VAEFRKERYMLVLSRKTNESITLDFGVEITVLAVNGNRVKLGVVAPDSVHIMRTELLPLASAWKDAETPVASAIYEQPK
jgi:carbon storage regulator